MNRVSMLMALLLTIFLLSGCMTPAELRAQQAQQEEQRRAQEQAVFDYWNSKSCGELAADLQVAKVDLQLAINQLNYVRNNHPYANGTPFDGANQILGTDEAQSNVNNQRNKIAIISEFYGRKCQ